MGFVELFYEMVYQNSFNSNGGAARKAKAKAKLLH
jgi:hypothetical protein